jgi:RNA-directed DNA polymerase
MPDSHSVGGAGKSGEDRVKDAQLTLGDLPVCPGDPDYHSGNAVGWTWEKSAEAVVIRSSSRKRGEVQPCLVRADEGLNLFLQATVWNDSMDVKRQQGSYYQPLLFGEQTEELRPGSTGDGGTEAGGCEESQASAALDQARALPDQLMEEVTRTPNLIEAINRVRANKGSAGVDGMTVDELLPWVRQHLQEFVESLQKGTYQPQPVRGVQIPKPGGGVRQLGIPTVIDRLVQQAILQVLDPLLDPSFSESSHGFRRGRGAFTALPKAKEYVAEGRTIVVDMDLEKFFDRVNHDILMARLARHVGDKRLLKIIRRFLEAGMMQDGVCVARHEGTPQGGPLSPLLANLLLDDLDKELERRGHRFCRYADDCNIYVRSKAAGERVLASVTSFLEGVLRLRVNREKSAVAHVEERKFLGHRLLRGGELGVAPKSVERVKDRIRQITRRNRGIEIEEMVGELNSFLTGWVAYFRYAKCRTLLGELEGWIRRKLRCVRLKQLKRTKTIGEFLQSRGVPHRHAWMTASSGKGWWRLSACPAVNTAMNQAWIESLGLANFSQRYARYQQEQKPPDTMSTSGGVGGRGQ